MVMVPTLSASFTTMLVLVESSFLDIRLLVERSFSVFYGMLVNKLLC